MRLLPQNPEKLVDSNVTRPLESSTDRSCRFVRNYL